MDLVNNKSLVNNQAIKALKKNLFSKRINKSSNNKINKKLYSTLNLENIEKEISNIINDKEEKKIIDNFRKVKNEKNNFKRNNTLKKDFPNNNYFFCREDNYNYNYNIIKNKFSTNENRHEYLTLLNDRKNRNAYNINQFNNNKLLFNIKSLTNRNSYNTLNKKNDLIIHDFDMLKFENKLLKDKIYIFLKLIRNYTKKLKFLSNIIMKLKKKAKDNNIYKELNLTINNLNTLINNPKLNENIFKIKGITPEKTFENENNLNNKSINKNILKENKKNLLMKNHLYYKKNNDYKNSVIEKTNIVSFSLFPSKIKDNFNKIQNNDNNNSLNYSPKFSIKIRDEYLNNLYSQNFDLIIEKTNFFNISLSPIKVKDNFKQIENNKYNNEKILFSLFNSNNDNNNSINNSPKFSVNLKDDDLNNIYSQNINLIINDYNSKIQLLEKENKSLNEKINQQFSNYNIIFNKANNLEIENKSLKIKFDNQKENIDTEKITELTDKIIILQKEINNKNNIINYLENLLKRINNNFPELNKYYKYKENNIGYNKINSKDINHKEANNKYLKCNSNRDRENKNNMNKIKNISNIEENEIEKNQNEISDISNLKEILNILDFPHYNNGININLNRKNKNNFNYMTSNGERNNNKKIDYKYNYNKNKKDKDKDNSNLNTLNKSRIKRAFSINNEMYNENNEEINFYINEHNQINREINYLDEEIFQLQSKLNQLLKE